MVPPQVIWKIVEYSSPRPETAFSEDVKSSVASLKGHPGFEYLLGRLEQQKAALETSLKRGRHNALKDVEFLQAGIFWSGWLLEQLEGATSYVPFQPMDPTEDEVNSFQSTEGLLELVGR